MSEVNSTLEGTVKFTRKWLESELQAVFDKYTNKYPQQSEKIYSTLKDVDIVFLAGGTCRIPFFKNFIKQMSPKAELIIDGELEIITATGAAIHALQVLNKEIELYILPVQHPIACAIQKGYGIFKVNVYDVRPKEESIYSHYENKPIQKIVDELLKKYGNDIGKIVINADDLEPDELEKLKENLKEHSNLFHIATKQKLDFQYYLELKVQYSVEDLVIRFDYWKYTLYECTEVGEGKVAWKLLDKREHEYRERIDFEHIERMFRVKMNQVHAVFEYSQERINSLYGSELNKYDFKSINFINEMNRWTNKAVLLARNLISDPEISLLVKTISYYEGSPRSCFIQDWGFIHISNSIKEYQSRIDITKINSESCSSTLTVSKSGEVQIVPFDSSPRDLWTDSPIIVNIKLLFNNENEDSVESVWHLQFMINEEHRSYMELMNSKEIKQALVVEINNLLEQMIKVKTEDENKFKDRQIINKAVITVPQYFWFNKHHPLISSAIEVAKSAGIEIIDIIEETHADHLYYLSNEMYSKMIHPNRRIAVFDINEPTCICRVYEISEYKEKKYATCVGEVFQFIGEENKLSERDIDNIIIKRLEESIPEELRNDVKLKTLEAARKIKHDLSSNEKVE